MVRRVSLKEVDDSTDRWTVVVRVFLKWNVYQKSYPSELFCISMLLIDEEGTRIQATVLNKSLHDRFRASIMEGHIYKFANFKVNQNVTQYRAIAHPFKITFTPQTYCAEDVATIPSYAYSFFPISEIKTVDSRHPIDYLIDVLAFVKSIGTLEEFRKDNEMKYRLRLLLADSENNEVECTLFDNCASDAYMAYLQNTESPVVILLNLARVGFSEDGAPQVCSSFNATRALFNPPTTEVKSFIESARDENSPVIAALSQPIPSQLSQHSNGASLHNQTKIDISDIPNQAIGESFVICCEIVKLETRHGWNYDGCAKCGSKAKPDEPSFICPLCKKVPQSIEPKMKIHYLVKDKTGSASVIFWDKLAVQLVQKTATELNVILKEEEREFDFPNELDLPVGKNVLLKLKINDYNKKHPTSSISVSQYTFCEDLMNQFNEANSENTAEGNTDVNASVVNSVTHVVESVTPLITSLHEPTIRDLAAHVNPPSVKGKRRVTNKRNIGKDDSASASHMSSVDLTEERVAKGIKQEK